MRHMKKNERQMTPSEQGRAERAQKIKSALWSDYLGQIYSGEDTGSPKTERKALQSRIAMRIIMRAESGELFEVPVVGSFRDVTSRSDGYKHHENKEKRDLARAARKVDKDVELLTELWG